MSKNMLDYQLIKELQGLHIVSRITILKESIEVFYNNVNHNESKLKFTVLVTLNNGQKYKFYSNKQIEKFLTILYEDGAV